MISKPMIIVVMNHDRPIPEDWLSPEDEDDEEDVTWTAQGTILFASRIFGRSGVGTFGATSSVYRYSSMTAAHHDFGRYGHGAGLLGSGMDVVFRRSETIGDKGFLVGYEENGQPYQNNGASHFSGGAVIWILGKYIGITSVHSFNVAGGYHQNGLEALNLARDMVRRMKR